MNSADRAMIAVRKQVREADEISLLNRRMYGIFRSMVKDAAAKDRGREIDFTIERLRIAAHVLRQTNCQWCERVLTAKNISWDHRIPVSRGGSYSWENLAGICSVCNGQKGSLREDEFRELRGFISGLGAIAKADILRRLGLGARWRS